MPGLHSHQSDGKPGRGRGGFSLITAAFCALSIVGSLGIAVDIGRLFVTKNEAQAHSDAAALDAALELDGSTVGLDDARTVVAASANRWYMGTRAFTSTGIEFSTSADGPWETNPASAANHRFVRVQNSAQLPIFFMPALGASFSSTVRAGAVAGQVEKTEFREGSFPFSPLAHDNTAPHFGLVPGQIYTLRWAANPKVNNNTCAGDNEQTWIDQAEAGGGSERGYIEETSSAVIRQAIEADYQTRPLEVGDTVNMTGGAKQTQRDSILTRISQDTDIGTPTFSQYHGNGRRLVAVPINTYSPNYTVLGFGAFFLLHSSEYTRGGNDPFCAEYVGPYVQGSRKKGAGNGGAYVVRLVR